MVSTNDDAFFLSYPEVFGQNKYEYYRGNSTPGNYEGTQYAYYALNSSSNSKRKFRNNDGSASGSAVEWWLRSPSSRNSDRWIEVADDGSAAAMWNTSVKDISPALCI